MYQVFIAEDEPAALQHLCNIIQIKCPDFQVVGTAENGKNALEQLEQLNPDILITDVRMPVMDGISLVRHVREKKPDILTVIISGYQEFSYAQSALRFGVCDYILKPVKPSALQESMRILEGRLDEYYYGLRNQVIRDMCTGNFIKPTRFNRIFPEEEYYIALLRKNSLPRRFVESRGIEIFSIKEEQMMVYGRDEVEALYICPRKLLFHNSFYQLMLHQLEKEKRSLSFYTLVLKEKPAAANELPEIIPKLYYMLDHSLIIGKNQIIDADQPSSETERKQEYDSTSFNQLNFFIKERDYKRMEEEIISCFADWEEKGYTQLYTEEKVREIFRLFRRENMLEESVENCEYFMDDAFYYAESMKKLAENICQILCRNRQEEGQRIKIDTPEFFRKIENYMEEHLSEPLSAQKICSVFGISQTYLSRLFRKYSSASFSKRLTIFRVEKARKIMEENRELFIKDVANMVGIGDQFYFSRIFRSVTGVSPAEYLKELKMNAVE
ncbi:response regulator transcription factor [Eisenbergiella sp.]